MAAKGAKDTKGEKGTKGTGEEMASLAEAEHEYRLPKDVSRELEDVIRECLESRRTSWGLLQHDMMFAVAFWSMLECGFAAQCHGRSKRIGNKKEEEEGEEAKSNSLPRDWKHSSKRLYQADFILPPHSRHPVRLLALPADDILCINLVVSDISPDGLDLRSVAVNPSSIVTGREQVGVPSELSGLREFHTRLRNAIIWPIRCSILTDEGIVNGSLSGLSDEIKLKILANLHVRDLLSVGVTCRDLHRITNDQGLWKSLFQREFCRDGEANLSADESSGRIDWKEKLKEVHLMKQTKKISKDSSADSFHTPQESRYGEFDFDVD